MTDIFTARAVIENNPAVQAAYEEFRRFSSNAEMREFERRRRRFIEDHRIYVGAARAERKAERDIENETKRLRRRSHCGTDRLVVRRN